MNRPLMFALITFALGVEALAQNPAKVTIAPESLADRKPPAPIWSGEGNVPAGSGGRKVFLSPDLHSVIILSLSPDGTVTKRRFDLHNTIFPDLRVHIESNSGLFRYRYDLENGIKSRDSLKSFKVVTYPDPDVQLNSLEWSKGAIFSGDYERVGIPGAHSGVLAFWTYKLGNPLVFLKPGATTSFSVISQARPGFTSASTEYFPHLDITDEWPEEIRDQLEAVLDPKWIAHNFITLGPRYGPDDPAAGIAYDHLTGIHELIRIHRLESDSPFVKETIALLDTIASGSTAQSPLMQKPQNELEAEILNALELSLQVSYKGPR